MIVLKYVEYKIKDLNELARLLNHIRDTSSKIDGIEFKDIYFQQGKDIFILTMDCISEDAYLQWRNICPPPSGANDWHEVLLTKFEWEKEQ